MRTQAVKGEMTPRAALDAMLAGTTLMGFEDARTGVITIRRGALFPKKASAAPRVDPYSARTAAEPLNEIVELSPFEITESVDDKWSATSTLLGNRTGQELVKVPVTVDVLTRDFMNDIGVFNLEDAAAFVSGVTAVPRIEAKSDNDRLTFRGLTSGGSGNVFAPLSSRNFFPWMVPSDIYNVERFDFGKGSNSLLFGDSAPGGQATTTTKRARFITANEGLAFYDSFGSYRLQLDLNRKINRQLAIRLNVVNRSDKSYVEGNYQRFRAGDIGLGLDAHLDLEGANAEADGPFGAAGRVVGSGKALVLMGLPARCRTPVAGSSTAMTILRAFTCGSASAWATSL